MESDLRFAIECIEAGAIPLIQLRESEQGKVEMTTVKGSRHSDFTAISHVWVGGLGNQNLNAMYRCQLQYLFESVVSLPPALPFAADDVLVETMNAVLDFFSNMTPSILRQGLEEPLSSLGLAKKRQRQVLVWIDTLCIPPMPQDAETAKHIAAKLGVATLADAHLESPKAKAIDSMAQLYAAAEKVLVIDPELRHIPSSTRIEERALAPHIRICPWMSRSWPLQEGALAQNIYFRLRDHSIRLDLPRFDWIGLPSLTLSEFYDQSKSSEISEDHQPSQLFSRTWNGLVNRSTTEPKDLPAIFAAMMGRSSREVMALKETDRMKSLLKKESELPLTLFYQPDCLRHGQWTPNIPGTDERQTPLHPHYGVLKPTGNGFVVREMADTICILVEGCPEGPGLLLRLTDHQQGDTYYTIRQATAVPPDPDDQEGRKSVFFLSKLCGVGSAEYHGARFRVTATTPGEIRLRFQTDVMWKSSRRPPHSPAESFSNSGFTKGEPLDPSVWASSDHMMIIGKHPFYVLRVKHGRQKQEAES